VAQYGLVHISSFILKMEVAGSSRTFVLNELHGITLHKAVVKTSM